MTSSLQIFNNDNFTIRTISENGNIWFVAKDVVQALEYSDNSTKQMNNLCGFVPEEWKGHKRIMTPGGEQEMLCLTEQGLYFFLGRSDKAKAIPYQKWIAGDVVPNIRATGNYGVNFINPMLPTNAINEAKVLFEAVGITGNQLGLALDKLYKSYTGRSALMAAGIELEAPVKEQPLTPTEIAEILGIGTGKKGARIVNTLLLNAGYQRRVGKKWEPTELGKPYAYMTDASKCNTSSTPIVQLKWYTSILEIVKKLAQEISVGMNLAKAV